MVIHQNPMHLTQTCLNVLKIIFYRQDTLIEITESMLSLSIDTTSKLKIYVRLT